MRFTYATSTPGIEFIPRFHLHYFDEFFAEFFGIFRLIFCGQDNHNVFLMTSPVLEQQYVVTSLATAALCTLVVVVYITQWWIYQIFVRWIHFSGHSEETGRKTGQICHCAVPSHFQLGISAKGKVQAATVLEA